MKQKPTPRTKESTQEKLRKRWRSLDRWIDTYFGSDEANLDQALANRFKSDADAIEEAHVPLSKHAALYGVLTLLAIAILWSILGQIDRIVVAPGKIVTRTPAIILQPFTTSRILSVPVRAGDRVKKGQLLVSFDPAFASADETSNAQKAHAGSVEIERLEAELSGAKKFDAGENDPDRWTQSQIFTQDRAELSAQMSVRDQRIGEIEAQIKADNDIIAGLVRQVETARKIVEIRQRLLDQGAGAPLDVMNAQTSEIDLEGRLKSTTGEAAKLTQQRAETEFERQTVLQKWRSDKNQQLVEARQKVADATQTLRKARKMSDLTELRAPVDGVILEVAQRSTGSVLREAETLITMVPDNSSLYVEANIPARDVGYVKVGQLVRIKLETYPFQRYGTIDGTLVVISPDSLPLKDKDDNSQMIYRAQVRLDDNASKLAGRAINLRPGLVASAEIKAGKRSIAAYILSPVLRTVDEGMREP